MKSLEATVYMIALENEQLGYTMLVRREYFIMELRIAHRACKSACSRCRSVVSFRPAFPAMLVYKNCYFPHSDLHNDNLFIAAKAGQRVPGGYFFAPRRKREIQNQQRMRAREYRPVQIDTFASTSGVAARRDFGRVVVFHNDH
jgi:hypothetical protein